MQKMKKQIEDIKICQQNIWNSRQIAADIEEKLANQGEVLCGGISAFNFPYETNGHHATDQSKVGHISQNGTGKLLSIFLKF